MRTANDTAPISTSAHPDSPRGTKRHKPTRRERRLQADANDWRTALRDHAALLSARRCA